LCFYLVIKGVGILQAGLISGKPVPLLIGWILLAICIVAAIIFAATQDEQARSLSERLNSM